jgi:hypothetical protein
MDAPLLQHETVVPAVHAEGECCYDTMHFTHFSLYLSRVYYY